MNGTPVDTDGSRGVFSLDSTVPGALPPGFEAFRHARQTQLSAVFPLPTLSPATIENFRVRARGARVRDVVTVDVHGASAARGKAILGNVEDQVRMQVVRRGAWTVRDPRGRDEQTVPAGQFLLRHVGRPSHFESAPHTTAQLIFLPSAMLTPLLGNRSITGPVDSPELRLLVAHTNAVHATIADLGPAGEQAAHSTLIELAKAVVKDGFDDVEPRLAPALAEAAKDLADSHLAHPELSPAMLARELNVSVRTLQRAFATVGESVSAYIRRRRLEEARLALTVPPVRLSVSELAAHWHFADSSHFIRTFKKHYGQTPAEYARSTRSTGS
ncbi:helix-turn-helix domain-containing protein [Streptomyces cavernae]|uniref:helix-turn-helix domain-containing protein n=1 Tax=Streptomyces cavernae TaxID=2259034 RepID=UPI001EE43FF6|nr:helix-turn-helix domain-containing protein [Streptomyces cavernae]